MRDDVPRETWLVTGASGCLGLNFGAFLEGKVHRVGVVRSATSPPMFDDSVQGELEDPATLIAAIHRLRPDVIVNTAAMASHEACERTPELARRINAVAAGSLSAAASTVGARFVQISTDAVFDGSRGQYTETDTPNPFSAYGRTKLEGEALVLATSDALVVRTNFFGWSPSGRRSILEFFVNELSAGKEVRGFTDFVVTSGYVQVLCEALWRLVGAQSSGILHVTSSDALSKYEFGLAVADAFRFGSDLVTPVESDVQPPRNRDISLDVSKAESLLGSALPSQRAGIALAHADADQLRPALLRGSQR